jgi:hypothetical protein
MANDMSPLRLDRPFDVATFLEGRTSAWGIFEDRFGRLKRRFVIDIDGQWRDGVLVVTESFTYDDGEREQRVWRIVRGQGGAFTGENADCIGRAQGLTVGEVATFAYAFRLKLKAGTLVVTFADAFYRMDERRMFNRAIVRKWGITLGVATIFFEKPQPRTAFSS